MANKFNFTKATIEALPIPKDGMRTEYWDTKQLGLQIRITATGAKSYYVKRRIKGKQPECILLGRSNALTIEQARNKAAEINHAIAGGSNLADIVRTSKLEMTLDDLFNEYMARTATFNKRPDKPRANYRLYLSQWGKRKLSSIKHEEVDRLHKKLGRDKGIVTANIALKLLHVMYNKAINEWRIWKGENAAHGIKKFPEQSRDRFIQSDELPKFFKALADEQNAAMRDYFLLSLLTGARRANVLAMQWADVNLERAEGRIKETKSGTPQTVTLSPEAVDLLHNRKPSEPTTFVFPGNGSSGHLIEPKKGWKRILERAGIDDLRIHDLRRTLGSWQAKTGASLAIIGKSLNHKNQSTTAIYARIDLDPVRDSVNTATSAMMAAAKLKADARKDLENQSLRRKTDFKIPETEQPKSALEEITILARLDTEPYDGIRGTLPVWMPPPVIKEFKKIRSKLQIGDRSTDRYTPDQIQQYIADYPSYLNNQKPEIFSVIPGRTLDNIDRLWVLKYATKLGKQDKQAGLAILQGKETAADILYGQKYKKVQPEKVRKPLSKVYNENIAINQIISMLAISSEHEKEIAKELWPHFYSELDDRNLHPYLLEMDNDITKWKCEYDFGDIRESITFRQFSNIVSESRNEFRTTPHSGLRVTKKKTGWAT